MIVSLLAAMSENRGIGIDGGLPWRLSADMQRFKELTMGHHLVMGRRTYESIGRPLPGRAMLVVSRNPDYRAEGCEVLPSLEAALALAEGRGETEAFVIGGAALFAAALPLADRLYLTQVHARVQADTFFPPFDEAEWREVEAESHPADERNQYPFTARVLVRKTESP